MDRRTAMTSESENSTPTKMQAIRKRTSDRVLPGVTVQGWC